ncbi:MAG: bile acid:sodium symporter family protein [Halioglobus sp.]|nr:bile acid:sodium symporter family protein [Halioglobus sp.]
MLAEFINNYSVYEYPLAASQLFFAMLGMGALLTRRDFVREASRPKALLIGLGFQWFLVPLIAVLVGTFISMPAGIAAGLVLLAAVPGGTLSNILTLFGRGNITLSISLTSITTVASLFVTPLILRLLWNQHLDDDFTMPTGRIAIDITLTLILPLFVGMAINVNTSTAFAERFSKYSIRFSLMLIIAMVVGAGGSGRLDAQAYGPIGILVLVVFAFVTQASGFAVSKIAGLTSADGLALVVEATFRNVSLAVAIKAIVFPAQAGVLDPIGDAVLFVAMLYGGISMFLTLVPVIAHRRLTKPVQA